MHLDLRSGTVALFGAGFAAQNKLFLLRSAGANVRWFANGADIAEEVLVASAPPGRLEVAFTDPLEANLSEFSAIVAATGASIDQDIADRARAMNIPVNVADRPDLSSFVFPATIDHANWAPAASAQIPASLVTGEAAARSNVPREDNPRRLPTKEVAA